MLVFKKIFKLSAAIGLFFYFLNYIQNRSQNLVSDDMISENEKIINFGNKDIDNIKAARQKPKEEEINNNQEEEKKEEPKEKVTEEVSETVQESEPKEPPKEKPTNSKPVTNEESSSESESKQSTEKEKKKKILDLIIFGCVYILIMIILNRLFRC